MHANAFAVLQVDEVKGDKNPVDNPSGAEDSQGTPPASEVKKGKELKFSPRPNRKVISKNNLSWEAWYANYKERMRAAKQIKETFYSFKLGDQGSPLRFECLNWDVEDNDIDESMAAHMGVATESIGRAWASLCSGKAALRRAPIKEEPTVEKEESLVSPEKEEPKTKGNKEEPFSRIKNRGYNSDSGTETDLEESPVFSCYIGAERLSGICNDTRGPAPYISVRVAAISTEEETLTTGTVETTKQKIVVKSWKTEVTTELVAKPLLFKGTYNKTAVRILYDPGSGAQVMSKSFAEGFKIPTVPLETKINLRYPNGGTGVTDKRSGAGSVSIQGVTFQETFLINPYDIPGVDLILGLSFQNRVRSEIRYPSEEEEEKGMPAYISFPTGERIYPETWIGADPVDCAFITAQEMHNFLKQEMKINKTLDDVQVYAVSVQKAMQLAGLIPIPDAEDAEPEPEKYRALREKYKHIFATDVPIEEILQRKSAVYHKIPLKEGVVPAKSRPIPLSAPMLEIAKELIADAVRLGLIEPGDPKSAWGAPIIILRKGGNRPGIKNCWRMVTDFRALNEATKKSTWTPPAIKDIMDDLVQCSIFSITDCTGGFYQLLDGSRG